MLKTFLTDELTHLCSENGCHDGRMYVHLLRPLAHTYWPSPRRRSDYGFYHWWVIHCFFLEDYAQERTIADTKAGTVSIFQYGAGPNGVMRTLGKYMLGSGATFGYVCRLSAFPSHTPYASCLLDFSLIPASISFFMSIGSVIRTEGPYHEAWLRARGPPMMLPREYPLRRTSNRELREWRWMSMYTIYNEISEHEIIIAWTHMLI